jgi:hypothetical protein
MTINGITPRTTAVICLLVAITLLALVWCTAPTRTPPAPTATPTYIPTVVIEPTSAAVLTMGEARPHWTRTPTSYVVDGVLLTPRPSSTPVPVLVILPTASPEPPTPTPIRTMTQKG